MKIHSIYAYIIEMSFIIFGLIFNILDIGKKSVFGFSSIGNYLIYIGFIGIFITTITYTVRKKRVIDERMSLIALKAGKITFAFIVLFAFIIMIADAISPITIPYHMFMSYFICGIILTNLIIYKILLKLS